MNTLGLKEQEVEALLQPSMDYISLIRKDIDFMRYHFTDAFAREKDEEAENLNGLAERADVIFTLMHKCPHFDETEFRCVSISRLYGFAGVDIANERQSKT